MIWCVRSNECRFDFYSITIAQDGNQISLALQIEVETLARQNFDDGMRAAGVTMHAEHESERGFADTDQHGEEHYFDFASCTEIDFRWAQANHGVRTMCDSRNDRLRSDKLLLWC